MMITDLSMNLLPKVFYPKQRLQQSYFIFEANLIVSPATTWHWREPWDNPLPALLKQVSQFFLHLVGGTSGGCLILRRSEILAEVGLFLMNHQLCNLSR
jgi:hypothetical protein